MKPYWERDGITLFWGDCLQVMQELVAGSVQAVVTDPPYGIAYCHGARKNGRRLGFDGHSIVGDDLPFDPTPWLGFPIIVLWGANHYANRLPNSSGWLVWDKRDGINSNDQSDCELAWTNLPMVARLKTRYWNGAHAREANEHRYHTNQKPVAVMTWCMDVTGITKGSTVLDPFMGSGTTGVACVQTGRKFIGIEISEEYCRIAVKRIEAALQQPRLLLDEPERAEQQAMELG